MLYIYIYIVYMYICTYICMYTFKYSDFHVNLHLPCCVPPSGVKGLLFQKELPEKLFMGKTFRENLWGGVHDHRDSCSDGIMEKLVIRSFQVRGSKMHFTIICKSIKGKSFLQPCWDIHFKNKP